MAHIKGICAWHGIPTIIYADNQPFNSRAFINFANSWGITVITSSPGFPPSNGQAEIYVSIVKQLMKKAEDSGKDPYIALLEYRNTPVSGIKHTPAQLAMNRMLRSKLPTRADLLMPQVVDFSGTAAVLRDCQIQYKFAWQEGWSATYLIPARWCCPTSSQWCMGTCQCNIEAWQSVFVHHPPRGWGTKAEQATSFEVQGGSATVPSSYSECPATYYTLSVAEGSATPAPSTLPPWQPVKPDTQTKHPAAANSSDPNKHSNLPPTVTSSGRQVKFPTKYDDFVMPTR